MAKGEIAHDEQFPLLPQFVQLYLMIKISFMEIFHIFANIFSKSSAAELSYVGKCKGNYTAVSDTILTDILTLSHIQQEYRKRYIIRPSGTSL